jgi:hypothetical protein
MSTELGLQLWPNLVGRCRHFNCSSSLHIQKDPVTVLVNGWCASIPPFAVSLPPAVARLQSSPSQFLLKNQVIIVIKSQSPSCQSWPSSSRRRSSRKSPPAAPIDLHHLKSSWRLITLSLCRVAAKPQTVSSHSRWDLLAGVASRPHGPAMGWPCIEPYYYWSTRFGSMSCRTLSVAIFCCC